MYELLTFDNLFDHEDREETYNRGFYFLSWRKENAIQNVGRHLQSEVFCILLCDRGEMSLSMGTERFDLSCNSLVIIRPGIRLVIHDCHEFEAKCIVFNPLIGAFNAIPVRYIMALYTSVLKSPVIVLSHSERKQFDELIGNFRKISQYRGATEFYDYAIQSGIAMLLCVICDLMHGRKVVCTYGGGRYNEYFGRFLQLLSENFKKERQVKFYADKLCITPKYLTTIVRELSGKSVSKWIHGIVIREACYKLIHGVESVQQISYDLNFPNQSFFGKYFKSYVGCSPSEYRLQNLNSICD